MRWARDHNRAGVQHKKGDKWSGPIQSGRWLYHRGHLEPDGDPIDALITGPKAPPAAWHGASEQLAAETRNAPQPAGATEEENGYPQ